MGGDAGGRSGDTRGVKRSTWLSLVLPLLACGAPAPSADKPAPEAAEKPAEAAAAPAAAARPTAQSSPKAAAPPPSAKERASSHFDAGAAKAQARAFREHLAAGRKAVKAKKFAEGIAAFEAALKIDPNHASALAELGWAAYLAGELGKAERYTRMAIANATLDRTRGAALYNLGRIHEDRGEKDEAATAYQRSLALRPNETVASRLAALQSAGAVAAGHECDFARRGGRPPFDLCAAVVAALPADEMFTENRCRESDTFTTEVAVDAAGTKYGGEVATRIALDVPGPGNFQVATFGVERWLDSGGSITEVYLAVLADERWHTTVLGGEYNPGVGYVGESLWIESITAEDVVPGGRPEVVVRFTWDHSDGDYGDNALESERKALVGVVSLEGDAPRWLGAFVASSAVEVGPMVDDEPSEVTPSRTERKVDYRLALGAVEIAAATGHEPSAPIGRFELGSLPAACPTVLNYSSGG